MADLMADMAKLLETPITAENQQEREAALTKLCAEMVEVQKAIDAENRRLAEVQAHISGETERLRSEAWRLDLQRGSSDAVHSRRHASRLNYDHTPIRQFPVNLGTPGAGGNNLEIPVVPEATQNIPPNTGAAAPRVDQPR